MVLTPRSPNHQPKRQTLATNHQKPLRNVTQTPSSPFTNWLSQAESGNYQPPSQFLQSCR